MSPPAVLAPGEAPAFASAPGAPWGQFHLATLIFRRAGQLRSGARPRVDASGHKLAHVAFLEVMAGHISWEVGLG